MKQPGMIRFTLRLDDDEYEQARKLAESRGISFSELVRRSVDSFLDLEEGIEKPKS